MNRPHPIALTILLTLAPGTLPAADPPADPGPPRYAELERSFDAAVDSFMTAYRSADPERREAMLEDPEVEPRHRFTPLFRSAARRLRGTPEALPFWVWLAEHGSIADLDVGNEAIERLLRDHLDDAGLGPAAGAIRRSAGVRSRERALADLDTLAASAAHPAVRAEALYQSGLLRRRTGDPEDLAAAHDAFERAAILAPGTPTAAAAEDALGELRPPGPGAPAPACAGTSPSGRAIDLSDLRGRVVLLEFWGMWCGPCVARLPELGLLEQRYRNRPFTVLGVNSDGDLERLRRFLEEQTVRWPNIADRAPDGPVASAWRVDSWPTQYLIDAQGFVLARDPSPEELESLLDRHLARAESRAAGLDAGSGEPSHSNESR